MLKAVTALRIGAIACAAFAVWAQISLRNQRPVSSPGTAEGAFAVLGGFRSLAAECIWFRADRLQDEGSYVELAQLAHALTLAEPHTPEVWSYAAWNLAYNVSVMMTTHEDRWRWVQSAIRLLRDDGLRYNPDSAELHRELAWMFELKIGANLDSAADLYRRKWRETIEDVEKRGAWEELKMEPMLMAELEQALKITDRADPQYSAAYWAYRGLKRMRKKNEDRGFLREILRQSLIIYAKTHSEKHGG